MLYEMVTGRKPFRGDSIAEMFAALLKEEPDPPSELAPDVPKELERIILRCLRKERERRFQHMGDVKVELQEVKQESDARASAPPGAASARRRSRRRWTALTAAGCLVLAAATAVTVWRLRLGKLPEPRVVLLAPSRITVGGAFSPDGTQIAFGSPGEKGDNSDIWLKLVGEAETRRLTSDPGLDVYPAWSPDGKQIAFVRHSRGASASGVYLVSPLGGPAARRLSEFPARLQLSWSPDSRWLAAGKVGVEGDEARGIHLIPTGGGEPRAVTFPGPHAFDVFPAFSPDGHALAYASCAGEALRVCDLYVLSLDAESRPQGAARALTRQRFWSEGLAWTRDGRSIVYGDGSSYLWRVRADGGSPPERMEMAGRGASYPFTVASRDRLGFVRGLDDVDIYRFQAGTATTTPLVASTAWEMQPQYSPDGLRIAFGSPREGATLEIWLADADGSNPTRLTRGPGRAQGSPGWSSDGRSIAFDSQGEDGRCDVWTIGVDGSGLRQVTHDASNENVPSFSRDGRWMYFGSDRTGRYEVWRVAAAGGAEEQVTRDGGYLPFESLDGRTLYYTKAPGQAPLLARPTAGGEERTIIGCVPASFGYAVGPEGVIHLDCQAPTDPSQRILRRWDARTGKDLPLATLDTGAWAALGLSVSADGRSILYTHATWSQDLMMIEGFR
jgi:Tol biopolymer transport system component